MYATTRKYLCCILTLSLIGLHPVAVLASSFSQPVSATCHEMNMDCHHDLMSVILTEFQTCCDGEPCQCSELDICNSGSNSQTTLFDRVSNVFSNTIVGQVSPSLIDHYLSHISSPEIPPPVPGAPTGAAV